MAKPQRVTRRRALQLGASNGGTAAGAYPIGGSRRQTQVRDLGPLGANRQRRDENAGRAWAEQNKVEVELDFLTAVGSKINITMAAEAQAKTGHDIFAFDQWTVQQYADTLDPVDDVMTPLIAKYGKLSHAHEYLAMVENPWMAVPVGWGSAPLTPCGRISMLKKFCNIDVQAGIRRMNRRQMPPRTGPTTPS